MSHPTLFVAALYCALSVAAGAFGAHGLAERLDARGLELWETASRYLMYAGLGLFATGLLNLAWDERLLTWAGGSLALGGLVFSGTVFALALGGPRILGAVTPIGGTLLIAGFALLAWTALRHGG